MSTSNNKTAKRIAYLILFVTLTIGLAIGFKLGFFGATILAGVAVIAVFSFAFTLVFAGSLRGKVAEKAIEIVAISLWTGAYATLATIVAFAAALVAVSSGVWTAFAWALLVIVLVVEVLMVFMFLENS
jgi:hypothetical protein